MSLKTVQRVTFSLPKSTIKKLEAHVPKNKRSKFVAEIIEKNISRKEKEVTIEEISEFWDKLADSCPDKTDKTAVELVREDRMSH